ncbi:MAG: hypothetical protein EPO07_09100 [Verrucomicrobia bacterium]|nr:MAG: hypothetical protein EPO07_09100 [Verrucomicrobiota bacterium]
MQRLEVLKNFAPGEVGGFLATIQRQLATNAPAIYVIANWMNSNQRANEAITWLESLPEAMREQQPVSLALSDSFFTAEKWAELEKYLANRDWKELEFLRLAYLSHAADKREMAVIAEAHWRSAVREANDRLGALTALLSLAGKWNKQDQLEELLWRIGGRFSEAKWAYRELERRYFTTGNTLGLNKVYSAQLESDPGNQLLKNNLASTSLLLHTRLTEAHQLAFEIYSRETNAITASTYAYSLHVQGKAPQGLAVLQMLDPDQLKRQPVACYYGLLLHVAGKVDQARPYLETAAHSRTLLPEEKRLVEDCLGH